MIKLIASDLDGTLVGDNYSIPESNLKAIHSLKLKNIPIVICTGKTYALSKDICSILHADFGIFGNGGQIIDLSTGKEIACKTLTLSEIENCFSIANHYGLHVHSYTKDSIITPSLKYMDLRNSILFANKIKIHIVDNVFDYIKKGNLSIFKLIISSSNSLSYVQTDLEKSTNLSTSLISKTGIYKDNIIDKEYEYLDISPVNVSKGNALETLSNYLKIEKQNILSIGDNLNDITMFKASNIAAAIYNSPEKVKAASNYITQNSAENGAFAEAVYKFISF